MFGEEIDIVLQLLCGSLLPLAVSIGQEIVFIVVATGGVAGMTVGVNGERCFDQLASFFVSHFTISSALMR